MREKILPFLNQRKTLLLRLICCTVFVLLLITVFKIIPYPHGYKITVTLKDHDPGKLRLYYTDNQFTEDCSIGSDSSFPARSFVFKCRRKVRIFRLDFDELHEPEKQFRISSIKINNILFSGRDAYDILNFQNQCSTSFKDNDLIVTVKSAKTANDVYLCFSPLRRYSRFDFFSVSYLVYVGFFLLLAVGGSILMWIFSPTWTRRLSSDISQYARSIFTYCRELWFRRANIILMILVILVSAVFFFVSPYFYLVIITFADKDPGPVKLYYSSQTFNERQTQVSESKSRTKIFLFADYDRIRFFRFDIDQPVPDGVVFTVEKLRINRVGFSGPELREKICFTNQVQLLADMNQPKLQARKYGEDKKILPAADDAYFVFSFPNSFIDTNFLGMWSRLFGILYFIVAAALAIWIHFIPVEKINRFSIILYTWTAKGLGFVFHFISRFYKEILLLSAISLFVFLRVIVLKVPSSRISFYVYEDAQCGLLIGVLAVAAILIHRKIFSLFSFLLLFGMYLIWFVDIYLKIDLNARFNFKETGTWVAHANFMMPIVKKAITQSYFFWEMLLVLTTAAVFIIISLEKKRKSFFLISTIGFTLVFLVLSLIPPPKSLFDGLDTNVFNYNSSMGAWKHYSPEYIKSVDTFSPDYQSVPGLNLKRNIILLVVESLSSYQSKYFSGLPSDNLKEFDNSLKDASSLSFKYRCSSYNTATNLFSLLTGYFPLLCPYGQMDFSNTKFYEHNLAAEFNREGYHTVLFLPVRFVDNVDVLSENCPFETIINDEDPFYNGADRYVFNGVADDVAFKRLVRLTQELKNDPKPHFIFVKTTTMHAPYLDPDTQTYSYEATVRFFDRAYKDFMNDLKASGYFDRGGIMIVTGDHRAMVPMGSQEQMVYGVWAIQKVPFVIYGKNVQPVDGNHVYNHVDLHFSLQYLMLSRAWKNRFQKNMFAPEQNQSFTCAFFQQYFNFAEVLLDTSVGEGKILLNGDKTQIKCPNLNKEQLRLIESYLVWARTKSPE